MQGSVLSQEQKDFAEKYHNIIYSFLNAKRLSEEDFYGVAALGYMKAVKRYHEQEHLKQYSFTTIAWRAMFNSVGNELTKRKRQRYCMSLDAIRENQFSLNECISLRFDDSAELAMESVEYQNLINLIPEENRELFELKSLGYKNREIAEFLGVSESRLNIMLRNARKEMKAVLNMEKERSENQKRPLIVNHIVA